MISYYIGRGHTLWIAVVIMVLVLLITSGAEATTITVDDSGGADFLRIQDAINASIDGDTILVYSGAYYENVNVTKQLILRGIDNGGGKPVVNASKKGSAITVNAGNSILEGFEALNSGGSWDTDDSGIYVNSNNNTIKNNTASKNNHGICLRNSSNNTITGSNAILNNYYGIALRSSSNNTLINNNANSSSNGIDIDSSNNNNLTGNIAKFNTNRGIAIVSSNNNVLISNIVYSNKGGFYPSSGISIYNSSRNTLIGNLALNNNYGIKLTKSNNNTLIGNKASDNGWIGIELFEFSNYNSLSGNIVNSNGDGIRFYKNYGNTLDSNTVDKNTGFGIILDFAFENILSNNNVSNNLRGIYLITGSSSNILYWNNIINNTYQSNDQNNLNYWDSGYPSGGNYWSNYTGSDFYSGPNQDQLGSDGIGDTPYTIGTAGAQDRYPLMEPWNEDNILIQLNSGWNLISLPLLCEDTGIASVLSPISGSYSIVWAYNASDTIDHWKKYDPATPFGNDLITMEPSKGYWIMMISDDTLNISGTMPASTDIELWSGWNLIGYNSLNPQIITDALSSIDGNYSIIWAYNASNSTDHWKKYDPNTPFGNDLESMEPGNGYWIMMTSDDIL